ncbi:MAG TPA: hypothetical protein VJ521_05325 [Acidobacteriota bacterium]|nr:hypothetical protein [Acidobacteriota bacterium]
MMRTKKPVNQKSQDGNTFNAKKTAIAIIRQLIQPKRGVDFALTERKIRMLFKLLLEGNYREVACRGSMIAIPTFYLYLKRGEDARQAAEKTGKPPEGNEKAFLQLLEAIEYCEANSEADIVVKARKESPIRYLQLRYRDKYHPKQPMGIDLENPEFQAQVHIYLPSNGRGPSKEEQKPDEKTKAKP